MRCPKCLHADSKVVDKRNNKDHSIIRRRRECLKCQNRYTTHEKMEGTNLLVKKRSGKMEDFDRDKLKNSILKGLKKRHIPEDVIDKFVDGLEVKLFERKKTVINSADIGQEVLEGLKSIDHVAYMLYATVYLDFDCLEDIESQIEILKD